MSSEIYTTEISPTLQDAHDSGSISLINEFATNDGFMLGAQLGNLWEKLCEQDLIGQAMATQLLGWCFSMHLEPGDKLEPFLPALRLPDGKTSATPYNLTPDQVELLSSVYPAITQPHWRARLADIVALKKKSGRHIHINEAIDGYLKAPIDIDSWRTGSSRLWHRALFLAKHFQAGAGSRLEQIEDLLFNTFKSHASEPSITPFFTYVRPLQRVGLNRYAIQIAEISTNVAEGNRDCDNLPAAISTYEIASYWYLKAKNARKAAEMRFNRAKMAELIGDYHSSSMGRQEFYLDALKYYRDIDGTFSKEFGIKEAITNVLAKIDKVGIDVVAEVRANGFPLIYPNAGRDPEPYLARVRDKDFFDAMLNFVSLKRWPSRSAFMARASALSQESVFSMISGIRVVTTEGRPTENIPPISGNSEGDQQAILSKAVSLLVDEVHADVVYAIFPCLSQIYAEHPITLDAFAEITRGSPIVPQSHAGLIAQGLYAGFQHDFAVAMHLLVPQFEHIVRTVLKSNQVITTNTDKDGLSMEVGLSSLIDKPELEQIFGPDVTFGIYALMCSQSGPNLRNNIAHGLVPDTILQNPMSVYTWWFILKLVFSQWYVKHLKVQTALDTSQEI